MAIGIEAREATFGQVMEVEDDGTLGDDVVLEVKFAPIHELKPMLLTLTDSQYTFFNWRRMMKYYLQSGTYDGSLPLDAVSYNYIVSCLDPKLLSLLEEGLDKHQPLEVNFKTIEVFFGKNEPLHARVQKVINFKQNGSL